MRILIVGAGIAGLTLAALLKQRGIKSEIIERQPDFAHSGYMLGLYPLGSKVLYGLNLMQHFLEATTAGDTYVMCSGDGSVIQELAFHQLFTNYGPYRCCSRKALIETLMNGCEGLTIKFNTTIQTLNQFNAKVHAILTDGTQGEYDLVVGADGMHSSVRKLIFTPKDYQYYDTGWGGWVWWSNDEKLNENEIREFWGAGKFFGIYPIKDKFGVIAAGPSPKKEAKLYPGRAEDIIRRFPELHSLYPNIFSQIPADEDESFFYWPLSDVRSTHWYKDRIVLLGDAAAGFLPTAGIGASMAMESAAVLAEELSRTDTTYLHWALSLYQKRRQQRVEKTQSDSRQLAKYMFVESKFWANLRNKLLKYYSLKSMAKEIDKSFQEPI